MILDMRDSLAAARKNPRKIPSRLSQLSSLTGVSSEAELFCDASTVYFYRDTTYAQMKAHWAEPDPGYGTELGGTDFFGDFTEDERDAIDLYHTDHTLHFPAFIRPATIWEIEKHNALERDCQRHKESTKILAKWGFDLSKGPPVDGIWDDDAERRGIQALEETRMRLEQLGMLEGSNYEFVVAGPIDDTQTQRELLWGEIVRETVTILEKWGFGRRGPSAHGSWDGETRLRGEHAFEEVKKKLESLGLRFPDDWDLHKDRLEAHDVASHALPK